VGEAGKGENEVERRARSRERLQRRRPARLIENSFLSFQRVRYFLVRVLYHISVDLSRG